MKNLMIKKPINNQRGVAILVAVFTFILVSAIAVELLEETQIEYITAAQSIKSIEAYLASGRHSVKGWLATLNGTVALFEQHSDAFRNINTPLEMPR